MTTIDIYKRRTGAKRLTAACATVFSGPARTLFQPVVRACQDGTASGLWRASLADV